MQNIETYKGNEPFIFISYAHADRITVEPIREQVFDECDELISVFAPKHLGDALAAYGKMINYY